MPIAKGPCSFREFLFTLLIAAVSRGPFLPSSIGNDLTIHERQLLEVDVAPTAAGVADYLEQLHPSDEQRTRIAKLIRQLGDAKFAVREAASSELRRLPNLPTAMLQAALRSNDPEVAWRVKMLLDTEGSRNRQILYAIFRTIELHELAGVAPQILSAFPFCGDAYLRRAAQQALVATVRPDDVPLLRRTLEHKNPHVRRAAVPALAAALGEQRESDMLPLLVHADPWIRLESARALADLGDRRSLDVFLRHLESDELDLRVESASLLRALTGKSFAFTAYQQPEIREGQVALWREWIAAEGKTARLNYPIGDTVDTEIGHTLVSLYNLHKVVELDAEGNEIRTITGLKGPWGAEPLPNGNLLVNWFSSHRVVEYDREGNEVWTWSKPGVQYVWSTQRLDNGNTLIACRNVVLEVDAGGKIVWKTSLGAHHSHAVRLENGNTLIALHQSTGKVAEVNRDGKVVWEIPDIKSPYRVQRLANGNTLVTEKGRNRVVEFDPTGKKEIWSKDGFQSPDSAQRLLNGNTLVSDGRAIYEVDPQGKITWQKPYSKSIIRRY